MVVVESERNYAILEYKSTTEEGKEGEEDLLAPSISRRKKYELKERNECGAQTNTSDVFNRESNADGDH